MQPASLRLFCLLVAALAVAAGSGRGAAAERTSRADGVTQHGLGPFAKSRQLLQDDDPEVFGLIQGGNIAARGRFPFMTMFIDRTDAPACGGVLIDKNWVLTAAHCLDTAGEVSGEPLGLNPQMVVGALKISDREGAAGVQVALGDAVIHPSWNGKLLNGFDIALVKLPTPSTITPIRVAQAGSEFATGEKLVAMGWGRQGRGKGGSEDLKWASLTYRNNEMCNLEYLWDGKITKGMMCAGAGLGDEADVCKGDSGGPLILPHAPAGKPADGSPDIDVLVGVVSFGDLPSCESELPFDLRRPVVFTRVSEFRQWIDDVIAGKITAPTTIVALTDAASDDGPEDDDAKEEEEDVVDCTTEKECLDFANEDLLFYAQEADLEGVEDAISRGADVDTKDEFQQTALHIAVGNDDLTMVLLLIASGADVDARDEERATPLIIAAARGDLEVVIILVEAGADVDAQDLTGTTALIDATYFGYFAVAEYLVEQGADIELEDEDGAARDQICEGVDDCTDDDFEDLAVLLA